ncbi:hypothetical protein GA0116948_11070 [Chitinophaga costaii]|uniref:Uncharacterized protein n=1 Tax=Chitinophaga costaii TaxID=1335309 RepID=A0A1C4EWX4_9BACT|nr:hypothetical protein [Chitinophaga costaii]PUZ21590.1 hypothetical protein DCM91_16275 [Chitinophaga costaii]SCC48043.1 hypothetical protein GA0116948_11070 [Chitinophaga costaii]
MLHQAPSFESLDLFIRDLISTKITSQTYDASDIQRWSMWLLIQKDQVMSQIQKEVIKREKPKKIGLFIQGRQTYFSNLINRVVAYEINYEEQMPAFAKRFYGELEDVLLSLLVYLQRQYSAYFDVTQYLPVNEVRAVQVDIKKRIELLRKRLTTPQTELRLLTIALEPYERWLAPDSAQDPVISRITYQQLLYGSEFLDDIASIQDDQDINCHLRTKMVFFNFNSQSFLDYCYTTIQQELEAIESLDRKLEKIAELEKIFAQLETKPHRFFTLNAKATDKFLLNLVVQERLYIENIRKIYVDISMPVSGGYPYSKEKELLEKAPSTLTLGVLAAMSKAFYLAGITPFKTQDAAIKFWNRHFGTKFKDTVTEKSFETKFYSIDATTKTALIDLWHTLISVTRNKV